MLISESGALTHRSKGSVKKAKIRVGRTERCFPEKGDFRAHGMKTRVSSHATSSSFA